MRGRVGGHADPTGIGTVKVVRNPILYHSL